MDPNANSGHASGLAQFTPATSSDMARWYPKDLQELCSDKAGCPQDAGWAIRACVLYDKRLWNGFPSASGDERRAFMLAAYNSGSGWANREQAEAARRGYDKAFWIGSAETVCLRDKAACAETKDYVHKILFRWRPAYDSWLKLYPNPSN